MKNNIVFIHGMFQNPKIWDKWINYFKSLGYNCIAPAWPFHEGEPEDLRKYVPEKLGELELQTVIDQMEDVVVSFDEKPILIGHSVGGLVVQLLVNKGLAEMGIVVDSVAPNAMLALDWDFFKNNAMITNPFKDDTPFYMDAPTFHDLFCNTMTDNEAQAAWEAYATYDSRNVLRDSMDDAAYLDLHKAHQPLLFIGSTEDRIIPVSLVQKNAESYTDQFSITDFVEFAGRSHFICCQPGWKEVAQYVADWVTKHEKLHYHTSETLRY